MSILIPMASLFVPSGGTKKETSHAADGAADNGVEDERTSQSWRSRYNRGFINYQTCATREPCNRAPNSQPHSHNGNFIVSSQVPNALD